MATATRRQTAGTARTRPQPRGGPTYPWGPGGPIEGQPPPNWNQFYPTEGHGRGDAWISPKTQPGGRLYPSGPFLSANDQRYAAAHPGYTPPTPQFGPRPPTDKYSPGYDQWLDQNGPFVGLGKIRPGVYGSEGIGGGPQGTGDPTKYNFQTGGWNVGHDPTADVLRMHGVKPGPLTNIGQGKGSAGTWTGNQITPPAQGGAPQTGPGSGQAFNKLYASQQKAAQPAAQAAPDYAQIRSGMKPGQTQKIGGKSYFLNQNGALVDVTDPKARKRLTDIQGNVLGTKPTAQAGGGPAPAPQTQPAATPQAQQTDVAQADPNAIPPWAQQLQDSFSQFQNQFGQMQRPQFYSGAFGGGYGGGGYGPMQQDIQSMLGGMWGGMGGGFGAYGGGGFQPMAQAQGGFGGGYSPMGMDQLYSGVSSYQPMTGYSPGAANYEMQQMMPQWVSGMEYY